MPSPSNHRRGIAKQVKLRPVVERLEARQLLASDLAQDYDIVSPAWYERLDIDQKEIASIAAGQSATEWFSQFIGPRRYVKSDWIVRLSQEATQSLTSFEDTVTRLNQSNIHFRVVAGLGLPGLVHVSSLSLSELAVSDTLSANDAVVSFSKNDRVSGQILPNDSDFGNMTSLHNVGQFGATNDADIDAPEAWDVTRGSTNVVVGVIDSGVDPTHPDLYLNIWLNQGEIPDALRPSLVDTDSDGLITFYDLNASANSSRVRDRNANSYIDAADLLDDPLWADGRDTDGNGFTDDFFGWNFRNDANEVFAPNNPSDNLGHGTHVAGTIGAIGNNSRGVTGINWRSSIMSLKFLDETNQGDLASAIAAVNYATMMRSQFQTNVRVLNNSWGQPGGFNPLLKNTIEAAGNAGILFVAAAGNGNILGSGVDNDRNPFYPASYESENVISVGASDATDRLAPFSNFGLRSVDIAAPGVGVRSTLPGGRYGEANGTSMATPHVAGAAAIVWSQQLSASIREIRESLISQGDQIPSFREFIQSGRRLNVSRSLRADVFAPTVVLVSAPDIISSGATYNTVEVIYNSANAEAIDLESIGDADIEVQPQSFDSAPLAGIFELGSMIVGSNGRSVRARYRVPAVGGQWDILDVGIYEVRSNANAVRSTNGLGVNPKILGYFSVRLGQNENLFYVDTKTDSRDLVPGDGKCEDPNRMCSLRAAIQESNARPQQEITILLSAGQYDVNIWPEWKGSPDYHISPSESLPYAGIQLNSMKWNDSNSGDLDVRGKAKIIGAGWNRTTISGDRTDRIFKVYPSASLELRRMKLQNGNASIGITGGAILNSGNLRVYDTTFANNNALAGGAITTIAGVTRLERVNMEGNNTPALLIIDSHSSEITQASLVRNFGGAIQVVNSSDTKITNSTISENGTYTVRNDNSKNNGHVTSPDTSNSGQFTVFATEARLSLADTNNVSDVYLYDRITDQFHWISEGGGGDFPSEMPSISDDARFIAFISLADFDILPRTPYREVYVYDRTNSQVVRVTDQTGSSPDQVLANKLEVSISPSGQSLAFISQVFNPFSQSLFIRDLRTMALVKVSDQVESASDFSTLQWSGNGRFLLFTDRSGMIWRYDSWNLLPTIAISANLAGAAANATSKLFSVNQDGTEVLFGSSASNLHPLSRPGTYNIFLKKVSSGEVEIVTKSHDGLPANGDSTLGRLSKDDTKIIFVSGATNLLTNSNNEGPKLYVLNRQSGQLSLHEVESQETRMNFSDLSVDSTGRFVFITSAPTFSPANSLLPLTSGDVLLYDSTNRIQSFPMGELNSRVALTHVTLASPANTESLPVGTAELINSIVVTANNFTNYPKPLTANGKNVVSPFQKLSSLSRSPVGTWYHSIPRDSQAWDSADPAFSFSYDQLGQRRDFSSYRLGSIPDVGAVETITSTISGVLYREFDDEAGRHTGEYGLPGVEVFLDTNNNGIWEFFEPITRTSVNNPATSSIDETGAFRFNNVEVGEYRIVPLTGAEWNRQSFITSPTTAFQQGGSRPHISDDGRFITFASTSNEIATGDTNTYSDIFVYDRELGQFEIISKSIQGAPSNGHSFLPMISGDGRFVVFESYATNLVNQQTSGDVKQIFVRDRLRKTTTLLSKNAQNVPGNAPSILPSINADGTTVVFSSHATNLTTTATFGRFQVYAYDLKTGSLELISKNSSGIAANQDSLDASVSNSGNKIVFASAASNLDDAGNTSNREEIFIVDRSIPSIRSISTGRTGSSDRSSSPSISASGDHVLFRSDPAFYYRRDEEGRYSAAWLYDLRNDRLQLTESSPLQNPSFSSSGNFIVGFEGSNVQTLKLEERTLNGTILRDVSIVGEPNRLPGDGFSSKINRDGDAIVLDSAYSFLIDNDTNGNEDVFLIDLPGRFSGKAISVLAGETYYPELAYKPMRRSISGVLFLDKNQDNSYDINDSPLMSWEVYLDYDLDGIRSEDEPIVLTNSNGMFEFLDLESELTYSIRTNPKLGFAYSFPDNGSRTVFLSATRDFENSDFAFVQNDLSGQSNNATISGRVFTDLNGDGVFQNGEPPVSNVTVYLDLNNNEIRDFNEPRMVTDANGIYSFPSLGNRAYTVRSILPTGTVQTSPIGSKFDTTTLTLSTSSTQLTDPQDVLAEDFNNDGWVDIAVALIAGNNILIRLNDGAGNFSAAPIMISTAPDGLGPIALAAGRLNAGTAMDLISANQLNGTVTIFRDFNGTGFASRQTLAVGQTPTDVVLGDFDSDGDVDAIVANTSIDSLTMLINDGNGNFTKGATFSSGGRRPTALVTGLLNNDTIPDIAVANYGTHPTGGDLGNVAVLLGRGDGTFHPAVPYTVGIGPMSIASGDFNGDGFPDLVTANFLGDTATVLYGSSTGTFAGARETLAVGKGPQQVAIWDVELDGDLDIVVTNLKSLDKEPISVLRNRRKEGGVGFEPAEAFGVANVVIGNRLAFAVADFDRSRNDNISPKSPPDIAVVNRDFNSLRLLRNNLVNGAHRIQLTGVETVSGLNFGTRPDVLLPTLNPISNPVSIVEDAPQQIVPLNGIALGRTGGPALRITATSSDTNVIPNPSIIYVAGQLTGELRFTPNANRSGQVTVTVTTRDAGADRVMDTADDGVLSRLFTVTVKPVNDAPTFTVPRVLNLLEDSTAQTLVGFATGISAGPFETQTLSAFTVTSDRSSLFSVQPSLDASGTLRFTPASNAVGTAVVSVTLTDNGDTAYGGSNLRTDTFLIDIDAVNDAPSITIGGNQTVQVGATRRSLNNFATGFNPGGGSDETTQSIAGFLVTVDKPDLFSELPTISNTGTLTYTPSATRTGTAIVTVRVRDSGGSLNSGVDQSVASTFNIVVSPLPDTTPPTPVLTTTAATIGNSRSFDVGIDFGENVTGLTLSDFVLVNATVSELVDLGMGRYTVRVTAVNDGQVSVSLPVAAVRDLANNNSLVSNVLSRTVDTAVPTAVLSTNEPNPTTRSSFPFTIQFSEPVIGFEISDLVLLNATVSNWAEPTPGRFTATLNAITDGAVLVGFSSGAARDTAGNVNSTPSPLIVSVNTGAANYKPLLSTTETAITSNKNWTALIDFGRVVTGFEANDLVLTNATATITSLGSGRFQINVTSVNEGTVTIQLPADRVRDTNNHPNQASDPLTLQFVDTTNSDFGDAPLPYPTRLQENGAYHKRTTLFLGSSVDAETNGQTTALANGDDSTGSDDEDGVTWGTTLMVSPLVTTTASVVVTSSGTGFLDAWIDYNQDGDWSDTGEQIANKVAVVSGKNAISFTIPSTTLVGTTFARFRLSSAGGLAPTGKANDGEVEDYQVSLVGGANKVLDLRLSELTQYAFTVNNGSLVVTTGTRTIWAAPLSELGSVNAWDAAGQKRLAWSPVSALPGVIEISSAPWQVSLVASGNIPLGTLSNALTGVNTIDLRAANRQTLVFQQRDIEAINTDKKLRVRMAAEDVLQTSSAWRVGTGRVENGLWIQSFVAGASTIEVQDALMWRNSVSQFDMDGDGTVSPLDVLHLVNAINNGTFGDGNLPFRNANHPAGFFDVDGDSRISPLDVLGLINVINNQSAGEGESSEVATIDLIMMIDLDDVLGKRQRGIRI